VLAEYQESTAATRLLAPLCTPSPPELRSAVGRGYLQAVLLDQALINFNPASESIANNTTRFASAVASPNMSANLSRVGSRVFGGWVSEPRFWGACGKCRAEAQGRCELERCAVHMALAQGDQARAKEDL
jgi:hypothetical protein